MWDDFYGDIDCKEFKNREEYENWVRAWVEGGESELGRIERWALGLDTDTATDELSIKIGGEGE